jgi:trans-2-enoyl-CoA reductase
LIWQTANKAAADNAQRDEEIETLKQKLQEADNTVYILASELANHAQSESAAMILNLERQLGTIKNNMVKLHDELHPTQLKALKHQKEAEE